MSILICIVFCLPTAAGEKMTLCMSILLALNLFQLLVTKILPPTSAVVPLIAKYLLFTFTLNVLVIGKAGRASTDCISRLRLLVNTVIITNFYYRTPMTHSMPMWSRRVFLHILPRLLWMESPKLREKRQAHDAASTMNHMEEAVVFQNPLHKSNDTRHERHRSRSKTTDKVLVRFGNSSDWILPV
jgi:nicotinic acetylcholine receptor, invertebrate